MRGHGRATPAQWARELLMGARFAVTGGRPGWVRTVLTSLGVAFGVAVLLVAASVPAMLHAQDVRQGQQAFVSTNGPASESTLLVSWLNTEYRDRFVRGFGLQPEGDPAQAVKPPGVEELPAPGEMLVSPALLELMESADAEQLLLPRFEGVRIAGTIGDQGLGGPHTLLFYLGEDDLRAEQVGGRVERVAGFGHEQMGGELATPLVLMMVVAVVVLLMPIAAFVAAAVRFGGERRDQRLAALRLVGADSRMTRRIAAGEALVGALFGLLLGGGLFLLGRSQLRSVHLYRIDAFPSDLSPGWALSALIVVLVPGSAVLVTQLALRKIVISPLGVAREGQDRGRRLWWRLAMVALGMASLFLLGSFAGSQGERWLLVGALLLTLFGVVSLMPWVVEYVVQRLRFGGLSWQLATRRLQLNTGTASRAVTGVVAAVAGAVALQMVIGAVDTIDRRMMGIPEVRENEVMATAQFLSAREAMRQLEAVEATEGVESASGHLVTAMVLEGAEENEDEELPAVPLVIGDCAALKVRLTLDSCADGDAFHVPAPESADVHEPAAGDRYDLTSGEGAQPRWWTVPEGLKVARMASNHYFFLGSDGFFLTPTAVRSGVWDQLEEVTLTAHAVVSPDDPDALERLRNLSPLTEAPVRAHRLDTGQENSEDFQAINNGLMAGSVLVMLLIGSSLLLATVDQLRERRRQLSVLVAFGVKRTTLAASVLWQTAIPVVLGLSLAVLGGLATGLLLVRMTGESITDWWAFLPLVGFGVGMIALVSLASLPVLWRMMRPDGLRVE